MSTGKHETRRKLLIIACSNRKLCTKGLLPAVERYDGGTYRVIRKAQRERYFPKNVCIKILSAKFGLIDASTSIPYYEQRMDMQRAQELRGQVQLALQRQFAKQRYSEIYIDLGADYLPAIQGFVFPLNSRLLLAEGRIGVRLGKLKTWFVASSAKD